MREAGHQGRSQVRSLRWCFCKGPRLQPAEMLTACRQSHLSYPGVSFPQIHSVPKEVLSPLPPFPWLCP